VLKRIRLMPYAVVLASGPVKLGSGSLTVATLTFTVADPTAVPAGLTDGTVVRVLGRMATQGAPLTLARLWLRPVRMMHHHGGGLNRVGALILGTVTALTPASLTAAGSLQVAGIDIVVPAGKTLRARVAVGARVAVRALVVNGALTLKRALCARRAPR